MTLIESLRSKTSSKVVTTPAKLSASVVRRVMELLLMTKIPILGLLENMSYTLDSKAKVFSQGRGKSLASEYRLQFLGELPIDPKAAEAADGRDIPNLLQKDFAKSLSSSLEKTGLLKAKT